ncbi:Pheromone shutdown protein [Thioalkalivibrio nitratireducens DSM 14787]|uniref:Pheromone shutdown protein n=1 Tax=Thioalkalivibrio nitratireducens (strain DSM 14787 / UNIQEM 213 / ALEN2) TaxID=1255043 RepID=L0DQW3_THIND|nr:TraB/GumN family protein [Thioalkalivibrio nitratireducens]AGA31959.1 Pheromone shutdown protein [Thioalkalivibrio nitratireducens DSM 14787]
MSQAIEPLLAEEPHRRIRIGDTEIVLLGTAHVSPASARIVGDLIATKAFDTVAIELCLSRQRAMLDPDAMRRLDLFSVIRGGQVPMVAASLALGAYQQRLAEQYGIEPGAEMRAAIDGAMDRGLPLALIDRDIGLTLRRAYRAVPWWQRMGLVGGLFASVLSREKIDESEIERLKQGDMLESTFSEFAEQSRELYLPLIDERDRYMAAHLRRLAADGGHRRILAVVGAGHLKGIENYVALDRQPPPEVLRELEQSPPRARWPRYLPWVVVSVILAGFVIGFTRNPELGLQMVLDWIMINGGLAALGGAIALAHPVTIVTAALAAPLTSLNPTIGVGFVAAAVELYLRKPQVGDFAQLRRDTTSARGWWRNRVSRVLLVFLLTTVGSALGTYIGGARIFGHLFGAGN